MKTARKAVALGGALGFAIVFFAAAAFLLVPVSDARADDEQTQTGSGQTSLVMHVKNDKEYGGTSSEGDLANPDLDGDGKGDNLAFTVPTRIDFLAKPDGALIGPNANVAYIENESVYSVHVSSLQVKALNGWNIVDDAKRSDIANSIDITAGPSDDPLNAASYLVKNSVIHPDKWNMGPRSETENSDRVNLDFSGHINNVSFDLGSEMTFGQIEWYVMPGRASE